MGYGERSINKLYPELAAEAKKKAASDSARDLPYEIKPTGKDLERKLRAPDPLRPTKRTSPDD